MTLYMYHVKILSIPALGWIPALLYHLLSIVLSLFFFFFYIQVNVYIPFLTKLGFYFT